MHCVDLGESFQTHIYLQNFASIQPRTSPVKFARSSNAAVLGGTRPRPRPRGTEPSVAETGRTEEGVERMGNLMDLAESFVVCKRWIVPLFGWFFRKLAPKSYKFFKIKISIAYLSRFVTICICHATFVEFFFELCKTLIKSWRTSANICFLSNTLFEAVLN